MPVIETVLKQDRFTRIILPYTVMCLQLNNQAPETAGKSIVF